MKKSNLVNSRGRIDFEPAYERAHGMEWLDEFYVKNQDELRKYF